MPAIRQYCGHPVRQWGRGVFRWRRSERHACLGEHWLYVQRGDWLYTYVMWSWSGIHLVAVRRVPELVVEPLWENPHPLEVLKMRKLAGASGDAPRPRLSHESKYFNKLPLVVEFVIATSYDDGAARMPGYLTLRNRGHVMELTAYDPDSGLRMSVCGPDIDHCYVSLNTLLGAETAPWVCDDYLTAQLAKKRKK